MGKQTIRELLDEHAGKIWSESRQENVLASDELAERVEAVLKLHVPSMISGVPINCTICRCGDGTRAQWPCPTIRALDGGENR